LVKRVINYLFYVFIYIAISSLFLLISLLFF